MPPPLFDCLRRCFSKDQTLRPAMQEIIPACNESAIFLNAELPLISNAAGCITGNDFIDSLETIAKVLLAAKGRRDEATTVLKDIISFAPRHSFAKRKLQELKSETKDDDATALDWTNPASYSRATRKTSKEAEAEDRMVEIVLRTTMAAEEYAFHQAVIEEKIPGFMEVKHLVMEKFPGCVACMRICRSCVCARLRAIL